jgi:tetratricopeptide (TPR) repeat protein
MTWQRKTSVWACWLLAIGFLAAGTLRAENDRITKYKDNSVIAGKVNNADVAGVEILVKDAHTAGEGAKITLAAAEISDIDWDVNDQEWHAAMSAFDNAQYAKAAQSYQAILGDADGLNAFRKAAKPALYYYCAESLYRSAKLDEAVPMFEKLMTEFKTSYYVPKAVGSLVDAAIQTKKLDKVPPLLNQLRQLGGEQKPLADYFEGQMQMAQGKTAEADKLYQAAASGTNVAATKGMALMGQAECAIAGNNLVRARDLAQKALQAGPPASVAGAAHLIIGDALVAEVDTQKPSGEALTDKLMDALLEYMRVMEQYKGDPRTEPQAMLKAGDCLGRLCKLPNRGGDRYRAVYMYQKLTNDPRYRSSRWAAQAAESAQKLR